jgi:hypothetical protein
MAGRHSYSTTLSETWDKTWSDLAGGELDNLVEEIRYTRESSSRR